MVFFWDLDLSTPLVKPADIIFGERVGKFHTRIMVAFHPSHFWFDIREAPRN